MPLSLKRSKKYAKEFEKFEIKAGYLDGNVLTANDVNVLADLPSRDELLAKMLSSMNAPVANFATLLANIPRGLVNVLTAVKDKKRELNRRIKMSVTKEQVIEFIENMTVIELAELVKELEEKFGVSASAPVAMMLPVLLPVVRLLLSRQSSLLNLLLPEIRKYR